MKETVIGIIAEVPILFRAAEAMTEGRFYTLNAWQGIDLAGLWILLDSAQQVNYLTENSQPSETPPSQPHPSF
jgi:hypothetical protein